jgi:hypothetical protein
MKYVLILHICSFVSMDCPASKIPGYEFNSFRDCIITGYELSMSAMKEMDEFTVNQQKIAIKFECKGVEVGEKTITPKPKPKIGA